MFCRPGANNFKKNCEKFFKIPYFRYICIIFAPVETRSKSDSLYLKDSNSMKVKELIALKSVKSLAVPSSLPAFGADSLNYAHTPQTQ